MSKETIYKSGDNACGVESGENSVKPMRECEFCGKKFSSGKALGGHKRFHLQVQRKERELANKAKNCDDDNNNSAIKKLFPLNSDHERLSCYLCKKDFPSEKSLFGHMRSHPDRDWRGIQPPKSFDDNNLQETPSCSPCYDNSGAIATVTATSISKSVIDVSKSLPPSWLKTDVRGRESLWASAARVLVSFLDESRNSVNPQQDEDDHKEEEADMIKEKHSLTDSNILNHGGHHIMVEEGKKRKLIVRFKNHHQRQLEYEDDGRIAKNLKAAASDEYKCNICDVSFPTFQALRGHRSSHNKEKKKCSMDEQRPSVNIGESSQERSKTPRNFDLNEMPNNITDEEN